MGASYSRRGEEGSVEGADGHAELAAWAEAEVAGARDGYRDGRALAQLQGDMTQRMRANGGGMDFRHVWRA